MPTYRYLRDALSMPLRYNPTGEQIFPCVRGVGDLISGARARFYLYYAPHENNAFDREKGGTQYLFYEAGQRLNARICIARAV